MSDQTQISDPHLARLTKIAQQSAQVVGGEIGASAAEVAGQCAVVLQGYIEKLHELANDPRLQEAGE